MQTDPSFTDGRQAVLNPLVQCLNLTGDGTTYQRYEYLSDSIDREAVEKEHADADGSPLGSDTREGFLKGAINLQLTKVTHSIPRPGHIIHLDVGDGDEYYIAGKFGRARTRNDIIKGALQVKRAYNPIITTLLSSAYGQRKTFTQAAGALAGTLAAVQTVVNTRTGATLAYSIAAAPGYTVPGWITCNASTGALSGTAVAGSWEFYIICTDTLSGEETRTGFGVMAMTITA
jgi:hypothetical protein